MDISFIRPGVCKRWPLPMALCFVVGAGANSAMGLRRNVGMRNWSFSAIPMLWFSLTTRSFEQWEASQAYWCQAVLLHCLSRTQWGLDHEAGYINIDNYHPSVVFIGPGSVLVLFSPWVKRSTWHWVWWQGLTIVLGPRSIPSSSHHSRRTKALP